MAAHASLTPERWTVFSLDQQVLMIANEMHRAGKLLHAADRQRLRSAYERVLVLVDLTVRVQPGRALRRELLRWRDLVAALYVSPAEDPGAHAAALRCLLRFTPEASKQLAALEISGGPGAAPRSAP